MVAVPWAATILDLFVLQPLLSLLLLLLCSMVFAMGNWTTILLAYLIGGVTFIPLVLVTLLVHGYCTLPYRSSESDGSRAGSVTNRDGINTGQDIVQPGDDTTSLEAAKSDGKEKDEIKTRTNHDIDVAAAYFAVCREYTPMGINAKPIERNTPVGPATVAAPSPSVYQTMYRSIFDRKPVTGPLDNNGLSQRQRKAGNVFYVVLRCVTEVLSGNLILGR